MVQAIVKTKKNGKVVKIQTGEIQRLFSLSSDLTDLLENILEARAEYSVEFLRGLEKSLKEFKAGKAFKVGSLANIR